MVEPALSVPTLHPPMADPSAVAVGTWSAGRFMRFGEPLDDERFLALITPDESIRTVITADVYGEGEADRMLGRALDGVSSRSDARGSARRIAGAPRRSA